MSAIMRRRRSLIGLSRIEGSCPEVGVLELPILRTGRPRRHPLSIRWLARYLPLAPLPRERVRSLPLNGHWREDRATAKKGDDLARRYVAPTGWTLATIGHRANGPRGEAQICEQRAAAIVGRVTRCPGP